MTNSTRIWAVGVGAVGGAVASRLVRSGCDLFAIDHNESHARLLADRGLIVGGLDADVATPMRVGTYEDAPFAPDVVLLAVRSQATRAALEALIPHLRGDTDVVSLQNGINEDAIADVIGADRTIGCVVGFGATWIEDGHITLDAEGDLVVGRLDGTIDDRLTTVADVLGAAFQTQISDNVRGALWGKMLVNSMTVLGALAGSLTGELVSTPERRAVVGAVIAEGVRVAGAEGVDVPPIFGRVAADSVDTPVWTAAIDDALERFGRRFGAIKSVTWRDFEIGRPTEIDAVTGAIVERGRAVGVATPLSSEVYRLLRAIEAGQEACDPSHLVTLSAIRTVGEGVG